MTEMHDWSLKTIKCEWRDSRVTFVFDAPNLERKIVADGVHDLHIPHANEWGPSISVNKAHESIAENGLKKLSIEMQSGDTITVIAVGIARS
jgi:hypothetical protein